MKPRKIYNKLKFGSMTQDHALSHQKKSSCLENGTSSCFDLKSLPSSVKESLLPNSDPKVIEEQILNGTWFSSAGMHKFPKNNNFLKII